MPVYEYACQSCGQHVDVYQRFNEEALSTCGVCGGPLRKVFHPAGILFKGSGFYATDSRSAARSSSKAGEKASEKPVEKDSGSKASEPAKASPSEKPAKEKSA